METVRWKSASTHKKFPDSTDRIPQRGGKFLLPSEKADYPIHTSVIIENSPSVIIEAFGLGVPVVSSDTGGSAELVKEGVNGFVFSAGSEKSLHDAIIRALSARDYAALSDITKKPFPAMPRSGTFKNCCALVGVFKNSCLIFSEDFP